MEGATRRWRCCILWEHGPLRLPVPALRAPCESDLYGRLLLATAAFTVEECLYGRGNILPRIRRPEKRPAANLPLTLQSTLANIAACSAKRLSIYAIFASVNACQLLYLICDRKRTLHVVGSALCGRVPPVSVSLSGTLDCFAGTSVREC